MSPFAYDNLRMFSFFMKLKDYKEYFILLGKIFFSKFNSFVKVILKYKLEKRDGRESTNRI
jgi:hypothetical protein